MLQITRFKNSSLLYPLTGFLLALIVSFNVLATDFPQTRSAAPAEPTPEAVSQSTSPEVLVLRSAIFDPQQVTLDFSSKQIQPYASNEYGIVQFTGAPAKARSALLKAGAEIVAFIPNQAFAVRWNGARVDAVQQFSVVRWADNYRAGYKVSPQLWPANRVSTGPVQLEVHGFHGSQAKQLAAAIRKLAPYASLGPVVDNQSLTRARFSLPAERLTDFINAASHIEAVSWIEPYIQPQLDNSDSVSPVQNNSTTGTPIWDQDIIGTGQIIGVADSGLDHNEE